jgi:hypothetical protein
MPDVLFHRCASDDDEAIERHVAHPPPFTGAERFYLLEMELAAAGYIGAQFRAFIEVNDDSHVMLVNIPSALEPSVLAIDLQDAYDEHGITGFYVVAKP